MGDKDNFIHIMWTRRKAAASEHWSRNLAITSPMRYRYTNFVCSLLYKSLLIAWSNLARLLVGTFAIQSWWNPWTANCGMWSDLFTSQWKLWQ